MTDHTLCPSCKRRGLYTEIERDTGICGYCADRQYEAHMERREFEHYHPPLTEPPVARWRDGFVEKPASDNH
jgi:hypothetical protein